MHFPSMLLTILLSGLSPAWAKNAVFPWADETERPECKSCLDKLVSDTCGGESDSGFDKCLCDGKGATQLNDECFSECCSASTVCTGQGPYREWWLQCVDDYPKLCADPPSSIGINRDLEEHCTREDIDQAKKTKAEEEKDDEDEKDTEDDEYVNDLGATNRDGSTGDGDEKDGEGFFSAGSMHGITLGNILGMAVLVVGMHVY